MVKVCNLTGRTGEAVGNQFAIRDSENGKSYFQSYNSLVALWDGKKLTVGKDYDYSKTTAKYLKQWIDEEAWTVRRTLNEMGGGSNLEQIRRAIKAGLVVYDEKMV